MGRLSPRELALTNGATRRKAVGQWRRELAQKAPRALGQGELKLHLYNSIVSWLVLPEFLRASAQQFLRSAFHAASLRLFLVTSFRAPSYYIPNIAARDMIVQCAKTRYLHAAIHIWCPDAHSMRQTCLQRLVDVRRSFLNAATASAYLPKRTDCAGRSTLKIQQRRIPALGGDVDADRLLGRIADQAVGAAGLGSRA